jgi:hypothetical protein
MDHLARATYRLAFDLKCMTSKGDEFQDFFCVIMERAYPSGDFVRVRTWGQDGDHKNDGYLQSRQMLFQVYGPDDITKSKAKMIAKMDEDFHGAVTHWNSQIQTWVFVHNSRDGLPPHALHKLLSFQTIYSDIGATQWGIPEIRGELFRLDDADIIDLLGYWGHPSDRALLELRFQDLEDVLSTIQRQPTPPSIDIRPVPGDKLSQNALSEDYQILLGAGMKKADLVHRYFEQHYNPTLGNEYAEAFHQQYSELRELNLSPDDIFQELIIFTGGEKRGYDVAVYAILAYFFEKCDIFERPTES